MPWLVSVLAVMAGGCGGAASRDPVGATHASVTHPESTTEPSTGTVASPLPPDFRTRYARISRARFASRGHANGRFDVDLYGNAEAQAAWRSSEVPAAGARFVEEDVDHTTGKAGPIYFMEKKPADDGRPGAWRFAVVTPAGAVIEGERTRLCESCHAEAPGDQVYRSDEL